MGKWKPLAVLVVVLVAGAGGWAESVPYLLKDINLTIPSSNPDSSPQGICVLGSTAFFSADDGSNGRELWKSDGSSGSTALVKDIQPGGGSAWPKYLAAMGSEIFFSANDGGNGYQLWKSDGTALGTVMLSNGFLPSGANPALLTTAGATLFFQATDGTNGQELWKTDGTPAGTGIVKDIWPGGNSGSPQNLVAIGSTLYFTASDGVNGVELWRSDGTAAGTVMLRDIYAGATSSSPTSLTVVGSTLYLRATTAAAGAELWKSDGTTAGTVLVRDIYPGVTGSNPAGFFAAGSTLYFRARDATSGTELWKSDGTSAGTVRVKDIYPGTGNSMPQYFAYTGGILYFQATDIANGPELWRSDGTDSGTTLVKDIYPGTTGSAVQSLTVAGGILYFSANNGSTGDELWTSDGTTAGTALLKDIYPGATASSPQVLTALGSTLLFAARDIINGLELWKSDGTAAGTSQVLNINPGVTSSKPQLLTKMGEKLYFQASDGLNGAELWTTDGTALGTAMLKDICAGAAGADPTSLTVAGAVLFFSASDGSNGAELWKSDGTSAGTALVKDIYPGTGSSTPSNMAPLGGTVFFRAPDDVYGAELWKSDGTADGTVLVKDICTGAASANPSNLTVMGSNLYFRAYDTVNGSELWVSDGTDAGTVLLKDIYAGSGNGSPIYLAVAGTKMFFQASDAANGAELWISDGTGAGTTLLKDIYPGANGSTPSYLTPVGSTMYFQATDGVSGYELWRSDGTDAGTVIVKDIFPGSGNSNPTNLMAIGSTLYFQANDGSNGVELWKTDGTSAGTVMIKDIRPGTSGSLPQNMSSTGGALFFAAADEATGLELWESRGSAGETWRLGDIAAGAPSSNPTGMARLENRILFAATNGTAQGVELWCVDLLPVPPANPGATDISLDSITWTWTDTATDETGFKLYDDPGLAPPVTLSATPAPDAQSWPHAGLEVNSPYTFQICASNFFGDGGKSAPYSAWTLIEPVSGLAFPDVAVDAITCAPANVPSRLDSGNSGIRLANVTAGTDSGWVQHTNPWTASGLTPNAQYTFTATSRNGAAVETAPVSASRFTLAAVPVAPVVSNPGVHTLDVAVGAGDGNPAITRYALHVFPEVGGLSWIQADGSLGDSPLFQTAAAWGTVTVIGLAEYASYSLAVTARNEEAATTSPGPAAVGMTLDGTPPSGAVNIDAGSAYTSTTSVALSLSAADTGTGVSQMQFSNDNSDWSAWEDFAPGKAWMLAEGDGLKTVYVRFRDLAGNASNETISDEIALDGTPPSGAVSINAGAIYTNALSVTLALSAADAGAGVAQMQFSNDAVSWSDWEDFAASKAWALAEGDGLKTVHVRFRDLLGNASTETILDEIVLDTTPPSGTVSINAGAVYANSASVTLTLSADDAASGVSEMQFSPDNTDWSPWEGYAVSKAWELSGGDGPKTIFVRFRDSLGNASTDPISDGITLDTAPPDALITRITASPTGSDSVRFSVQFSEPVAPTFTPERLSLAGSLDGALALDGAGPEYTVTITLADPDADGDIGILIDGLVSDAAGNPFAGAASELCEIYNWRGFAHVPESAMKYAGDNHTFSVTPDCGASTPAYQWKWDNGAKIVQDGPTSPSWTLPDLSILNRGDYWCEVSYDGLTYATAPASLFIEDHVSILQPPLGGEGELHKPFTFSVTATGGYPPLTYQWMKGGESIPFAVESQWTIPALEDEHAGAYSVVVHDANGDSVLSGEVVLTVSQGVPLAGIAGLVLFTGLLALIGVMRLRLRTPAGDT